MINEIGVITRTEGTKAWVRVQRSSMCEGCKSSGVCNSFSVNNDIEAETINTARGRVDDIVMVEMKSGSLLKITFCVYMVPAMAIIAGAFLGLRAGQPLQVDPESAAAVSGIFFLLLSVVFVKILGKKVKNNRKFMPEVVKIIPPGEVSKQYKDGCVTG